MDELYIFFSHVLFGAQEEIKIVELSSERSGFLPISPVQRARSCMLATYAFLLIAILFHAGIATAQSSSRFSSAAQVFQEGKFAEAVVQFEELSAAGDSKAKSFLGYLYTDGTFVEQDLEKAIPLLESASRKGNAEAHFNMAVLYKLGKGVPQSTELAALHFKAAANAGHPKAQLFLGGYYYAGDGVPKDPEKGYQWLNRSLKNGVMQAQGLVIQHPILSGAKKPDWAKLAADLIAASDQGISSIYLTLWIVYAGGLGVEEDVPEALKWLYLAVLLEHPNAEVRLQGYLARHKLDNKALNLAALRSAKHLRSAANQEGTYIGRASHWCRERENGDLALVCVVKAISHHEECEAPFFPGLFDGYVESEAYKYCRRKLFKESRRKFFNESEQE